MSERLKNRLSDSICTILSGNILFLLTFKAKMCSWKSARDHIWIWKASSGSKCQVDPGFVPTVFS